MSVTKPIATSTVQGIYRFRGWYLSSRPEKWKLDARTKRNVIPFPILVFSMEWFIKIQPKRTFPKISPKFPTIFPNPKISPNNSQNFPNLRFWGRGGERFPGYFRSRAAESAHAQSQGLYAKLPWWKRIDTFLKSTLIQRKSEEVSRLVGTK